MTENKKHLTQFKETVLGYYAISDESFALFEDIIEFQTFERDTVLLDNGNVSKHIYFICQGAVIAFLTDDKGTTYTKNIFLENQFAGSTVSALLQKPSEFTLQAIERTTLISINYKKYKDLISQNDDLKNFYIAYLEKNWVIDKEQREVSIVMENATSRYLNFLTIHPNSDKRIPLQHIASHLGITPTQLSRIRKYLKENTPNQHM